MTQSSLFAYFAKVPAPEQHLSLPNLEKAGIQTDTDAVSAATNGHANEAQITPKLKDVANSKPHLDLTAETLPGSSIVLVDSFHIGAIKALTSVILPIRYPDKFFTAALSEEEAQDLSRVALMDQQPVGWIRCRCEANATKQLYIQALCVLALYRERGLATQLLEQIVNPYNLKKYEATSIFAHVWESNEDALEWYQKRGFRRIMLIEQYYRRLRPSGAWIVRKDFD